jgi:1,4-alpha-glucan branching enzyme
MSAIDRATIGRDEIRAVVEGRHGDPFAILGPHRVGGHLVIRAFLPGADRVAVLAGSTETPLERIDDAGLFEGIVAEDTGAYLLTVTWDGSEHLIEDPYRFPLLLSDYDLHLLAEGTHYRSYERLGAHPITLAAVDGVSFAVWAPNASRVAVVGDFNVWDARRHPMRKRPEAGIWELFIPGLRQGAVYKYAIDDAQGNRLPLKSDPYAFHAELRPNTASIVWPLPDKASGAREAQTVHDPISVYEVHLGSWKRGEDNRRLTYRELADDLLPYVRNMGFTHIELMPIHEHPFDGSWGYQPIGLFAPTSRFGTPDDFRAFVERAHALGLRVIIDWVPGHFPSDAHGLARFDGTALYEHEDPRLGMHMDWGTLIYNFGRREVANFLIANALYWCERFGIDGLRVDAVASMLYLNYSRKHGEWLPNRFGGVENEEAVAMLRRFNEQVFGGFPRATTIAEESTAWPMVSRPTNYGGLGFGFKWNMGWMHDTLAYVEKEAVHRRYHHHQMSFGLIYAFSENFVLPLSHDEVVYGKKSLLSKMPGDDWQRFANLRAYFGFMWTHPGKKLLFMGGEFGQWNEWNYEQSLDWHLLSYPHHQGIQALVRDLNQLYRGTGALHLKDCEPGGFEWIDANDSDQSVYSYLRRGRDEGDIAIVVCNFTPVVREGYRVGVPFGGAYVERLNTDSEHYGGGNVGNAGRVEAGEVGTHGRPWSLLITLPPLATLVFTPVS